jgi:hypothetical protein
MCLCFVVASFWNFWKKEARTRSKKDEVLLIRARPSILKITPPTGRKPKMMAH